MCIHAYASGWCDELWATGQPGHRIVEARFTYQSIKNISFSYQPGLSVAFYSNIHSTQQHNQSSHQVKI